MVKREAYAFKIGNAKRQAINFIYNFAERRRSETKLITMKSESLFQLGILKPNIVIMTTNRREKETTNEIFVEDGRMRHWSICVNYLTVRNSYSS